MPLIIAATMAGAILNATAGSGLNALSILRISAIIEVAYERGSISKRTFAEVMFVVKFTEPSPIQTPYRVEVPDTGPSVVPERSYMSPVWPPPVVMAMDIPCEKSSTGHHTYVLDAIAKSDPPVLLCSGSTVA
tara:strand:+ start:235 stop:633 length:399 start_codon:yes stop_codon:yes gene_type:complete